MGVQMKKAILLIFSLCLVIGVLILCGAINNEFNILGKEEKNENTIYIGVYQPKTGDDAKGAAREILGIRYAYSLFPTVEIGGATYNIELLEVDNMSNKSGAADAAQTLVNANVTAVLGSYDSENTAEAVPSFEKANIPVIGISCASPLVAEKRGNFFRMCFTDAFQSGVMANYAYSMDYRKAAVLTQTADIYSKAAGKMFTEEFLRLGGEAANFSFRSGQENYNSLITEIKDNDVDIVFMMSGPHEAKYFIEQSRKQGLSCPIMGPENWDSGLLLSEASFYSKDIFFASAFDADNDPVSAEFAKRFSSWISKDKERIKENGGCDYSSSESALAYDAYMLVIEAIKASNSSDPQIVMDAIRTISYDGVTGKITFGKDGESGKKLAFIKTINLRDKKFEVLQTISTER
jgi:branched-chain amino acid transport system substrate-binding protein